MKKVKPTVLAADDLRRNTEIRNATLVCARTEPRAIRQTLPAEYCLVCIGILSGMWG